MSRLTLTLPHGLAASRFLRSTATAMMVLLSACGGGGGGGDAMQISFDRSSVSLSAQENVFSGERSVDINAVAKGGSANESVYVGAELQGVGITLPIAVSIDTVARTARITLTPNATLAPGTYSGTVKLLACKDTLCAAQHIGSPFNVSYTVAITPRFKATPLSLNFASVETVQPQAQEVQVILPQGVSASTSALEFGEGVAPWLQLQTQGQNYSLRPAAGLAVGTYNAVLRVEAGNALLPIRIPVQHRVGAGLVLPTGQALTLNSLSPSTATRGEVAVTLAAGINATPWQASSNQP